jgi:hypothetical protein
LEKSENETTIKQEENEEHFKQSIPDSSVISQRKIVEEGIQV